MNVNILIALITLDVTAPVESAVATLSNANLSGVVAASTAKKIAAIHSLRCSITHSSMRSCIVINQMMD